MVFGVVTVFEPGGRKCRTMVRKSADAGIEIWRKKDVDLRYV